MIWIALCLKGVGAKYKSKLQLSTNNGDVSIFPNMTSHVKDAVYSFLFIRANARHFVQLLLALGDAIS